ncbi:hypothetical protein EJB05_39607 [Eragrostis curvula]|uniref:Uncharacterized protein n=1 Tax=Eragrostis curvula TaxID=38414 RepID=A0A5J9TXD5_9POAL|nr:hypothetical protein EJB05_39607 [Eragrostis curvula]
MSRGGSSGGGRSSLSYLFEPEEFTSYQTCKSKQETEKTLRISSGVKDDKMIAGEADQELQVIPSPPKKEVSNPIVPSHMLPFNIYHTSQLNHNSGLLITDRPSTRVRCAPGGPSSLGFLFSDENEK